MHTYASVYAFRFGSLRYSARTHWLHVIPMISPNSLLISLYYTFFFLLVGAFFLSSSEQYNFYEASTYTRIHILGRYIRTYSEQLNESCSRFFLWQCKRCCLLSFLSSDVVDSFSQHVLALASLSLYLSISPLFVCCVLQIVLIIFDGTTFCIRQVLKRTEPSTIKPSSIWWKVHTQW